jgi:hypothetical protein
MAPQIFFSRSKSHGPTALANGIPVIGPLLGGWQDSSSASSLFPEAVQYE